MVRHAASSSGPRSLAEGKSDIAVLSDGHLVLDRTRFFVGDPGLEQIAEHALLAASMGAPPLATMTHCAKTGDYIYHRPFDRLIALCILLHTKGMARGTEEGQAHPYAEGRRLNPCRHQG